MSLTPETLAAHLDDPAVLCCRRPKGLVISADDFEDPTIFPDLEDSALLTLSSAGLTIRQALGKTLAEEVDALTPLTADLLVEEVEPPVTSEVHVASRPSGSSLSSPLAKDRGQGDVIHLSAAKIEGLDISLPVGVAERLGLLSSGRDGAATSEDGPLGTARVMRTLTQRQYSVTKVTIGDETALRDGTLTVAATAVDRALASQTLVTSLHIDVIEPTNQHVYTNTIMDVMPIAAKAEGELGSGVTNVLNGVVVLLTGVDENGVQIHEFGSCEGYLDEKVAFGRPGAPDAGEIILRVNVVLKAGTGMERRGPLAAHEACDALLDEIRDVVRTTKEPFSDERIMQDVRDASKPRVLLVKEIMGQGAMHDNVLVPDEPAGVRGGRKNVDLGNVPVMLSPNEVRDGGIHALTCIGPATKETTRHYWREPLVHRLAEDPELGLVGVAFIGSPQVNDEKRFVSERLGALVEALDLDGAIVTTEGFGNNHIDFAENIAVVGSRGVPVVGVTFAAYQGALVVGNEYMDAMIEVNKDVEGFENEELSCSTICPEDARRAIAMLKAKMSGATVKPAERRWDQSVVAANQGLVDAAGSFQKGDGR